MKSGNRDVWVSFTLLSNLSPAIIIAVTYYLQQIGLVDKSSKKLFWYNLRDEQSFWMTPEDQERYKAEITLDSDERGSLRLAPTGPTRSKTPKARKANSSTMTSKQVKTNKL